MHCCSEFIFTICTDIFVVTWHYTINSSVINNQQIYVILVFLEEEELHFQSRLKPKHDKMLVRSLIPCYLFIIDNLLVWTGIFSSWFNCLGEQNTAGVIPESCTFSLISLLLICLFQLATERFLLYDFSLFICFIL